MNVLIVGGHGFIGSHFSKEFIKQYPKAEVTIYDTDKPNGKPSQDIKNARKTGLPERKMPSSTILYDYIFHFGALASLRSKTTLEQYMINNVYNLQVLLRSVRYRKIIYISSSSVITDNYNYYKMSKQMAELIIPEGNLIIRPCTVFGLNGRPDMLVTRVKNKEKITVNGDPETIFRYYTYVGDLVKCIMQSFPNETGTINAIGNKLYSIKEVLELGKVEYEVGEADTRDFGKYTLFNNDKYWFCNTSLEEYLKE